MFVALIGGWAFTADLGGRACRFLQCPERLSAIEYQLAPGGPWRTAAISPGNAENVGFVEIAAE